MRKIRFRGKRLYREEWIYGLLEEYPKNIYVIADYYKEQCFPVEENTIGQFTGMKDKNDNDIYEGDILSLDLDDIEIECKGVVKYRDRTSEYVLEKINNHKGCCRRVFELGWVINQDFNIEIIGNIYDNKELLEAQ